MKYFFYLPLFFTTHMPLKTNLLWISQVCLLPKTCNNSLNLLIPPQQVSCLCQQGSSPLLSEMPIMAPPHRWGNGDSVLWRDSSQGIQIVGRSSGLQHQLSSILMLCCCWNCLILVRNWARYWVHAWLIPRWEDVPHQLLPCWRSTWVLGSIPPLQRPFGPGLFMGQVQTSSQFCPEACGHTCFSIPIHLFSTLFFSQHFLTTLEESKTFQMRFGGGI